MSLKPYTVILLTPRNNPFTVSTQAEDVPQAIDNARSQAVMSTKDCVKAEAFNVMAVFPGSLTDIKSETPIPPDPDELNGVRSLDAAIGLDAFRMETEELNGSAILPCDLKSKTEAVANFLSSLGHYCDRNRIVLVDQIIVASKEYSRNTSGQGRQFQTDQPKPANPEPEPRAEPVELETWVQRLADLYGGGGWVSWPAFGAEIRLKRELQQCIVMPGPGYRNNWREECQLIFDYHKLQQLYQTRPK